MNPEEITRQADIIISAVGQPNMVKGSWIKPGAVIIDVGINPVEVREIFLSLSNRFLKSVYVCVCVCVTGMQPFKFAYICNEAY